MVNCPICHNLIGYPYIIKHNEREIIVCNVCYDTHKAVTSLRNDHLHDLKMSRAKVNKYNPNASNRIIEDDGFLKELVGH